MKTTVKFKLKSILLFLSLVIFVAVSVVPAEAQVTKRDHRTKKKNNVRDQRAANKVMEISQTLNFDEGDAIFGTRTELQTKYPGLKFTGKIDRTMITKKLPDGKNLIHKTTSGDTLYAMVKKGKITAFEFFGMQHRRAKRNLADVSGTGATDIIYLGTSNKVVYKNGNKPTCFNCTEICPDSDGAGHLTCWITLVKVDCSKNYNARIQGQLTPSPGPIPIPYPNILMLDSIKR